MSSTGDLPTIAVDEDEEVLVDKEEDINEIESDSEVFSDEEEDEDPFERKPFKQRMARHLARTKRFFTKTKYRNHVLRSIPPKILNYYVEPESVERKIVDLLMVITIMWNVISVPYRTCFETHTHVGFFVVDVVTDVIAWINLVFQLLQAVEEHGELIKSRRASWKACFNVCVFAKSCMCFITVS